MIKTEVKIHDVTLLYQKNFDALSKITPQNKHDKIELAYLMAKYAYILYDMKYFNSNPLFTDKNNVLKNENIGELIWYLTFLCSNGNTQDVLEIHEYLEEQVSTSGDKLLKLEFLYPHFLILSNQRKFTQVFNEFLEKRSEILQLSEDYIFTKSVLYSCAINVVPYIEKDMKEVDKIFAEIDSVIDFQKDPFSYCEIQRYLIRTEFLKLENAEKNRIQLQKLLSSYSKIGTKLMQLRITLNLGLLEYYNENYVSSVNYQKNALQLANDINSSMYRAYISFLTGIALAKLGDYKDAELKYLVALEENRKQMNEIQMINILDALGNLSGDIGQFKKAEDFYLYGIELAEKHEVKSYIASIKLNLAILKLSQGDLTEVAQLLKEANDCAENTSQDNFILSITSYRAKLAYMQGNYKKAIQLLDQGKKYLTQSSSTEELANFYLHEAEIRLGIGQVNISKEILLSTYNKQVRGESLSTYCEINVILGMIHLLENKAQDAKRILIETYEKLVRKGSFGKIFQSVLIHLLEFCMITNDEEEYYNWKEELFKLLDLNKIPLLNSNEIKLKFLELLRNYNTKALNLQDLDDFEEVLNEKQFINLKYKVNLLRIRFLIDSNQIDLALDVIQQLECSVSSNPNLIFEIEIKYIQGLILSRDFNFDDAIESVKSISNILKEYELKLYIQKQEETLKIINEHAKIFAEIYELPAQVSKDEKQKEKLQLPLEIIHEYIDKSITLLS